jgi:2-oxoisovalerate dehydrogenase E1 component alpha subunit
MPISRESSVDSEVDPTFPGLIEPPDLIDDPSLHSFAYSSESLSPSTLLNIYRLMVRTRALEERTIKMSKSGEGFFWVGGPGEEAFNVCLGLQIKKGAGPANDYLHLHYRNAGVLLAMGMSMQDHVRQMAMTRTDPHSMGRNFVGHYAIPAWNVIPVTSVIEVQYVMAPGTALMQKRAGSDGVTVVIGGDAGTAEGDFASCMIWSSRPQNELPVLMIVTNNGFGISTPACTQHGEERIADRAGPFGIRRDTIDGNNPIACWRGLERAFNHCRKQRRPYMLEARVSRLYGHSSSSGAQRIQGELDCLAEFEKHLLEAGILHQELAEHIREEATDEANEAVEEIINEDPPTFADLYTHTYARSSVDAVYPEDFTGLPGSY